MMKTMLLAAAALALAGPALADDVPGDAGTTATVAVGGPRVQGVFDQPGDSDWYEVRLEAGQDYVSAATAEGASVVWRDQAGKVLSVGGASSETGGAEFHAPYAGWYYVEMADFIPAGPSQEYPKYYDLRVLSDCADSARTLCVIKPGVTRSKIFASEEDFDQFALNNVVAGHHYVATLTGGTTSAMWLVDKKGNVLAGSEGGPPKNTLAFTMPALAAFIRATSDDEVGFPYTLALDQTAGAKPPGAKPPRVCKPKRSPKCRKPH